MDLNVALPIAVPRLHADPRMLSQILINLVSNALKFTESGGVITVSAVPNADGGCSISVQDTGLGIAREDLDKVVEPFVQVDSDLNCRYEGTGLGLALVKKMMELHDGRLEIESEIGRGTTVTARFPASRVVAPSSAVAPCAARATDIIRYAIWLYARFTLSFRDIALSAQAKLGHHMSISRFTATSRSTTKVAKLAPTIWV